MSTATIVLDLVRAREGERIRRRLEIAVVVSLLLHAIAVYEWLPREPLLLPGDGTPRPEPALTARLARAPSAQTPPPAPMQARPAESPAAASPRPTPRPRPRPQRPHPVMTAPAPAPPVAPPEPSIALPPPEPVPVPVPMPAPLSPPAPPPVLSGDLSSYIRQQRAARGASGEAAASVETETARRDRIVAENLASLNRSALDAAPQNGGGTFQIRRMEYDDAQFTFYGWNRAINRRLFQVIDVERGANPTINLAIVRKIIAIIREHEPADFRWHSKRLGRDLTLSARREDAPDLEAFMMQEFFTESLQPR